MTVTAPMAPSCRTGVEKYLARCGGRDVLRFEDPTQAIEAARTLRSRHPEIDVIASYERVEIRATRR